MAAAALAPPKLEGCIVMTFTMRRENREEKGNRAWLDTGDGGPLLSCTLVDISESGAKLAIEEADQIPERFILRLSRYGQPRLSCRTVWRNANTLGVTFAQEANQMISRL